MPAGPPADRPRVVLVRAVRLLLGVGLVVAGALGFGPPPAPSGAAVGHVSGYRATVLGFTSWYGSYDLGALGVAWCIDHGIAAPDPALQYVPTGLGEVHDETRTALAWAVGRHGPGADRIVSAALMLVAHDLMGARYPYGPLRVDALDHGSLAGFGADGAAVLARARDLLADARAHAGLRGPWALELSAIDPAPGAAGELLARLTAGGQPVDGLDVSVLPDGAELASPAVATTAADGTARFAFRAVEGGFRFTATARVPDLGLQAFAPTLRPAQRVARPATLDVVAELVRHLPPPTTSTTSSTTTSTSSSTTTSTTSTSTTTTSTTTTTPTTTTSGPPVTSPPTSAPSTSTAPPPTARPALPRTGTDPSALATTGAGLVLLGTSLPRRRPHNRSAPDRHPRR